MMSKLKKNRKVKSIKKGWIEETISQTPYLSVAF